MSELEHLKGKVRAASLSREIERAQRSLSLGPAGLFVRVALVLVFMYIVLISYMMMGIAGPIFVSIAFLIALIVPVLHHRTRRNRPVHGNTSVIRFPSAPCPSGSAQEQIKTPGHGTVQSPIVGRSK